MNPKLAKLLYEGFSMSTLENLTEKQMTVLLEKIKNAETKEETTKTIKQYNLGDKTDKDKFVAATKTVTDPSKINFDSKTDTATVGEMEMTEKSVSKKQRGLMGAAYAVEKGDKKLKDIPKSYRNKVKDVVDSMSKKQVKDFASTKDSELDEIERLEENILRILENHLPPHTTKGELVNLVNKRKK
jgi:hypothetical protein